VRYLDGPGFGWNWYREFDPPLCADEGFSPGRPGTFLACAPPVPVVAPAFARAIIRCFRWTVSNPRLWHGPPGATSLPPLGFHPIRWGPSSSCIRVYLCHSAHLVGEGWQVEELPPRVGLVEPYVEEDSLALGLASGRILSPQQWVELGATQGLRLRWVGPEGEPVATFHVPADYGDHSLALDGEARDTGARGSSTTSPNPGALCCSARGVDDPQEAQRGEHARCAFARIVAGAKTQERQFRALDAAAQRKSRFSRCGSPRIPALPLGV